MSTRSVIARKRGKGFRGVYHHWDGYPEGVGKTLFALYNGHFNKDLATMLAYLIDEHPAGWSTINKADFSLPPGFIEDFKTRVDNQAQGILTGPKCYCHGDRHEKGYAMTDKNASGSGCEYAYVFEKNNGNPVMHVLSSFCEDGEKMMGFAGFGDPKGKWRMLASVNLNGEEPDWQAMRKNRYQQGEI